MGIFSKSKDENYLSCNKTTQGYDELKKEIKQLKNIVNFMEREMRDFAYHISGSRVYLRRSHIYKEFFGE